MAAWDDGVSRRRWVFRLPAGRTAAVTLLVGCSFIADVCGRYLLAVLLLTVAAGETFVRGQR